MKKEFEKYNCSNCKNCDFGKYCPKLAKANDEYRDMMNNQVQKYSEYIEKHYKKTQIEKQFCCDDFKNQWLDYPFVCNDIKTDEIDYNKCLFHKIGALVKIRPCGDEYKNKTYLGFYLGDLPTQIVSSLNSKTSVLKISTMTNPAIFVPELKKIVFGYESWWGEIKDEKELKEITSDDIDNVWYVKLLKAMWGEKND